jgi:hypothetical protein
MSFAVGVDPFLPDGCCMMRSTDGENGSLFQAGSSTALTDALTTFAQTPRALAGNAR